jgi:hypothetical protein
MRTAMLITTIPLATIAVGLFIAGFIEYCARRKRTRAHWRSKKNYDGMKDFAGSLDDGYEAIRKRMREGGPGWQRKS